MIRKTQPKQEKNMETEKKIDEEAVDIGDTLKSFIKKAERELEYCSLSEKDILVKLRVVDLLYVATKDAYELKGLPAKEALRHILGRIFSQEARLPEISSDSSLCKSIYLELVGDVSNKEKICLYSRAIHYVWYDFENLKRQARVLPFEFKIAFGREDRVFETKFINPSFDYLGYLKESLLVACERNAQRIGKLRALIGHLKEIKNVFPQEELKSLFPHEEQ